MIDGADGLAALFSIFHDGVIVGASLVDQRLILTVEITHLAARVGTGFTTFRIHMHDVRDLTFITWPKDAAATPQTLRDLTAIFVPPLDILEGAAVGDQTEVVCNQPSSLTAHCGGTLSFRATSADVTDQQGNDCSLADLAAVADAYWKEWSERKSAS